MGGGGLVTVHLGVGAGPGTLFGLGTLVAVGMAEAVAFLSGLLVAFLEARPEELAVLLLLMLSSSAIFLRMSATAFLRASGL